jgi:hypothetical protein
MVLSFVLLKGENMRMGGLEEKTLKKENGLRLQLPSLSMVETRAIGLGATR